jgi:carbon storage regulator
MLVLRRRVGESILVGNDVEIEIIEISRSRVKLGVRAPCHTSVIRKETVGVSRENRMASDLLAARGPEGMGELLELLYLPRHKQSGPLDDSETSGPTEDGSTKQERSRYVTTERYSGYRGNRENPHPA